LTPEGFEGEVGLTDTPEDQLDARPERAGIHLVPQESLAETERTLAATPGIRGEPSDAERSRTLVTGVRTAALATLGDGGFPFGSMVSHAVDSRDGRCCCCPTWPSTAGTWPPTGGRHCWSVSWGPGSRGPVGRGPVILWRWPG
jgi:hypothetical protein